MPGPSSTADIVEDVVLHVLSAVPRNAPLHPESLDHPRPPSYMSVMVDNSPATFADEWRRRLAVEASVRFVPAASRPTEGIAKPGATAV
ncbi:hypothetical protein ACOMHN_060075 [Nucella lapillus]